MYPSIAISSGHGKYVRGASGVLDEVDEARKVVDALAKELRSRGYTVGTFHDNTSHDQGTNLETIVNAHNGATRDLDVSVHFNAYVETSKPMGVEVLYVTQDVLAARVSSAIASVGFIDRGPKYRDDLYFLNCTDMPALLLEICFVDSESDATIYRSNFDTIIRRLADSLVGSTAPYSAQMETTPYGIATVSAEPEVNISTSGNVRVILNGKRIN